MHPLIQAIKNKGIPIASVGAAAEYLGTSNGGIGRQSDSFYQEIIRGVANATVAYDDSNKLYMTSKYLVCEVISAFDHTDVLDGTSLLREAEIKADRFMVENPWTFAKSDEEPTDEDGNVKPKKGSKSILAKKVYLEQIVGRGLTRKEAISILVDAGVSTPAGSSTYYARLKKDEL